ncbi:hypothetical protein NL676_024017 [Syzygium grande]|nr:hypothetical protein NL676_024017 [Syzygium grande]
MAKPMSFRSPPRESVSLQLVAVAGKSGRKLVSLPSFQFLHEDRNSGQKLYVPAFCVDPTQRASIGLACQ